MGIDGLLEILVDLINRHATYADEYIEKYKARQLQPRSRGRGVALRYDIQGAKHHLAETRYYRDEWNYILDLQQMTPADQHWYKDQMEQREKLNPITAEDKEREKSIIRQEITEQIK